MRKEKTIDKRHSMLNGLTSEEVVDANILREGDLRLTKSRAVANDETDIK